MNPIRIPCPHCSNTVLINEKDAGLAMECPQCKGWFSIETGEQELTVVPLRIPKRNTGLFLGIGTALVLILAGAAALLITASDRKKKQYPDIQADNGLQQFEAMSEQSTIVTASPAVAHAPPRPVRTTGVTRPAASEAGSVAERRDAQIQRELEQLMPAVFSLASTGDVSRARAMLAGIQNMYGPSAYPIRQALNDLRNHINQESERRRSIAYSLAEMGDINTAAMIGLELLNRYPDTTAARRIKYEMDRWASAHKDNPAVQEFQYSRMSNLQRNIVLQSASQGYATKLDVLSDTCRGDLIAYVILVRRAAQGLSAPLSGGPSFVPPSLAHFENDLKDNAAVYVCLYDTTTDCDACDGQGHRRYSAGTTTEIPCDRCEGKGHRVSVNQCTICRGTGFRECTRCLGKGVVRRPYSDTTRNIRRIGEAPIPRDHIVCATCQRTGRTPCTRCDGQGELRMQHNCYRCERTGNISAYVCGKCDGNGKLGIIRALKVSW